MRELIDILTEGWRESDLSTVQKVMVSIATCVALIAMCGLAEWLNH